MANLSAAMRHDDWWPSIRLLAVFCTLALWAKCHLAWQVPAPTMVQGIMLGMAGVLVFCGLLSLTLARLYLALVLFPLFATTTLNVWLYDLNYWVFRTALRLLYMRRISAVAALAGELGMFVGLCRLLELVIRRYGL